MGSFLVSRLTFAILHILLFFSSSLSSFTCTTISFFPPERNVVRTSYRTTVILESIPVVLGWRIQFITRPNRRKLPFTLTFTPTGKPTGPPISPTTVREEAAVPGVNQHANLARKVPGSQTGNLYPVWWHCSWFSFCCNTVLYCYVYDLCATAVNL